MAGGLEPLASLLPPRVSDDATHTSSIVIIHFLIFDDHLDKHRVNIIEYINVLLCDV